MIITNQNQTPHPDTKAKQRQQNNMSTKHKNDHYQPNQTPKQSKYKLPKTDSKIFWNLSYLHKLS